MLGVSFDTPEDNRAFAENNGFGFRLLSDTDRIAGHAYETVRAPEESMPDWAKRRTYLIDPAGTIVRAYRVRDAGAHPDALLDELRTLIEA